MIVLVCGSRTWGNRGHVERMVMGWHIAALPAGSTVLHGGAKGADSIAGEIAAEHGFEVEVMPANWNQFGKRAGILRNLAMLDRKPDKVMAFSHGTPGTQHVIDEARKRGIPVEVYGREMGS